MSVASLTNALTAEVLMNGETEAEKTLLQKVRYAVTNITVEPMILMAVVPSMMNYLATQNLNLEKSCRVNLRYNTTVCDAMISRDLSGYELDQEAEVQKLVSKMIGIKMSVIGSWPVVLMLFLGAWSDRHGLRKPLFLAPLIGDLIGTICLLICAHFFLELPVEYSMLAETVPSALGGTWACGFLGIYTYVSGLCTDNERTLRIGAVTMCHIISITIGTVLSGFMLDLLGFKGVYILSIISMSISLAYGCFMIKEKRKPIVQSEVKEQNFLIDFFSLRHIENTFKTCFRQDVGNRRLKIFIIMLLSTLIMGPLNGESSVVYLFARRRFGWNEIDFSIYNSLVSVVQILGGIFALAFFSKYLKLDDSVLGIISMLSRLSAVIVFAFAKTGFVFYIGGFLEVFQTTCHISMRALMSKTVPPHELGQSNSVFGLFEAVTPLIFGPVYSNIYSYTIKSFPGMFFIFSGLMHLITFCLFIFMYKIKQSEQSKLKEKQSIMEHQPLNTGDTDTKK